MQGVAPVSGMRGVMLLAAGYATLGAAARTGPVGLDGVWGAGMLALFVVGAGRFGRGGMGLAVRNSALAAALGFAWGVADEWLLDTLAGMFYAPPLEMAIEELACSGVLDFRELATVTVILATGAALAAVPAAWGARWMIQLWNGGSDEWSGTDGGRLRIARGVRGRGPAEP